MITTHISEAIDCLTFSKAVWLFCPAFVLHVMEEWPRFTGWARLHASVQFTQSDYNLIHVAGTVGRRYWQCPVDRRGRQCKSVRDIACLISGGTSVMNEEQNSFSSV